MIALRLVVIFGLLTATEYVYAASPPAVQLESVFGNQVFNRPLAMYQTATDRTHWYVVEQAGRVLRIKTDGTDRQVFVDIRSRVDSGPNEAGLLGLAFHPDFERNQRVFLSYTASDDPLVSHIAEYRLDQNATRIDPNSERIVLKQSQPYGNHNGGQISFGPDGFLYIGFGDGGAGGDPLQHGQNTNTLLGTMLRIDVDQGQPYGSPRDNPFAAGGGRAEIFAYGLRNPWRWSFDRKTGELWLADVGQNKWEEVNRIVKGGNYGWNIKEGKHCFRSHRCRTTGLIDPIVDYGHDQGCSITGGYVYRGSQIPALRGWYVYADYCSGTVWGLDTETQNPQPIVILSSGANIASFAEDHAGELYVLDHSKGRISRMVPAR
jgi:glucose/arabinose dehydrogenase